MTELTGHDMPEELNVHTPEEKLKALRDYEQHMAEIFGGFSDDDITDSVLAAYRAAMEGLPTYNPEYDEALRYIFNSLLTGTPPEPAIGSWLVPKTFVAHRVLFAELVRRIAAQSNRSYETPPEIFGLPPEQTSSV